MRCNACQCDNPPDARYCTRCGTAVAPSVDAPQATDTVAASMGGLERRSVTIMFCDLVGSTALSGRLDPEDLGTVLLAYRETVSNTVRKFGGFVARYVGDSLLVYFGYPLAHDDDAVRALQAAMQIRTDLAQLSTRLADLAGGTLSVHIGIHTGEVIAGEFGSGAMREAAAVVGETPNIAARLQGVAGADEVIISHATHRLVQGRFVFEALPQLQLRGVDLPQSAYRLVANRPESAAADHWQQVSVSELLGREEELGLLAKRWRRVQDGDGQVALVSGEAGIGKTRLLQALATRIGPEAGASLTCQCSPYFTNSAFFPFADLVRRQLKLGAQPTQADIHAALAAELNARKVASRDALPLVAAMLAGAALPDATSERSPQAQRDTFMEWLAAWLVASPHPLILIVEDLHWADASTLDFLGLLVDQIASSPVFLLLSFRSEFRPPWPIRSNMFHLTLGRLSSGDVRAIVDRLTEGKPLPATILAQVIEKTDGVPLFVEEFTKMVIEAGVLETPAGGATASASRAIDVPDTLRGSLLARLDRQGEAKSVAQIAAVIDREISFRLLQAVCGLSDDVLKARAATLVDAELLLQRGVPPESHYTFKHSLIRDAAYQSLLKSSRAVYHRQTAEALLANFPALAEGHPEFVAHHFSKAGLSDRAFGYWRAAGMRALEASANVEASAHLAKALEEVASQPESAAQAAREVELQIALGTALTAARGYGSTEVERTYARAYALCENLGDERQQLFAALSGLHSFYQVRGPLQRARDVALRLVRLAERSGDQSQLAQAHRRYGWSLFCSGQMREGKEHLDRALGLYDATRSSEHSIVYGAHPWIVGFVNSAWLEWVVGHPQVAIERSRTAVTLARELGRPLSLAYALCMSAAVHQCDADPQQTLELAANTVALARENSMPYWIAWGSVLEGWALVQLDQFDTGFKTLESGLRAYRDTGAELFRPYSLCLLAEACRAKGRVAEALDHLDEALASAAAQGVQFYTAEIHRLRGDLALDLGREPEVALAAYRESMALANAQGALAFELRAAASLADCLLRSGDAAEAVRVAKEIARRLPQGLASADARRITDIAARAAPQDHTAASAHVPRVPE